MKHALLILLLSSSALAGAKKPRHPASGVPLCWKSADEKLHDGLFRIALPASDALTAKDLHAMLRSLQSETVANYTLRAQGESILLEAQLISQELAKKIGFANSEELTQAALKGFAPYFDRGVTIRCLEEQRRRHH